MGPGSDTKDLSWMPYLIPSHIVIWLLIPLIWKTNQNIFLKESFKGQ